MNSRQILVSVIVIVVFLGSQLARADDADKEAKTDLNELSLEVAALQTLYQLQFTHAQMAKIRQCAKECAENGRQRRKPKASKEYSDKLQELHKALVVANDDDLIEQLSDELEDLRNDEKPDLDDDVKPTKEARHHATAIVRLLKVNQYAAYAGSLTELVDPLDLITESLSGVRALKGVEWRDKRKQIAAEIGRLVGGIDADREEKARHAVSALLSRVHKMKKQDFEEQKDKLEADARQIIGDISPVDIIRNEIEYTMAELLSNVRLQAVLAARLQL